MYTILINFSWKSWHGKIWKTVDLIFEAKHQSPPSLVGPSWMWTLRTFAVEWFLSCVGWCPESASAIAVRWWNLPQQSKFNKEINDNGNVLMSTIFCITLCVFLDRPHICWSFRAYSGVHHVFQIRIPSTIGLYHHSMTPGETRDICKFLQRIWSMGYHGICLSKVLLVREGLQDDAAVWLPCREL